MSRSIKGHPFQERLRSVPLKLAATFVSTASVEEADKPTRAKIFREFGRLVIGKHKERRKFGFNSDPGGEIARGLEQAYQAGLKAASLDQARVKTGQQTSVEASARDLGDDDDWIFDA